MGAPQQMLLTGTGDPFYPNVLLLLPFSDAAGATTFTDKSPSPHTITNQFGSPTALSTPTQFSGITSVSGNSTGLNCGTDTNYVFSTGVTFTYEMWIFRDTTDTTNAMVLCCFGNEAASRVQFQVQPSGQVFCGIFGSSASTLGTNATVPTNAWTYVAITRNSTNGVTGYINGTALNSPQNIVTVGNSNTFYTGSTSNTSTAGIRYWQQARLTRGVVRNITAVPATPFPTRA